MKIYQLQTTLAFGKNKGKTIEEIISSEPSYLAWCLINIDHFHLSENAWALLKNEHYLLVNQQAHQSWQIKEDKLNQSIEEEVDYQSCKENSFHNWEDNYGSGYEKYGGYNGWSDDAIDDAFEGDPDATWNVD
jgi:hypothetical protein